MNEYIHTRHDLGCSACCVNSVVDRKKISAVWSVHTLFRYL